MKQGCLLHPQSLLSYYLLRGTINEILQKGGGTMESESTFTLTYTGHPFVDVGLATICAMTNKRDPGELVTEDLKQAADEIRDYYTHYKPVRKFLTVIFTNSHFVQHAKKVEQREDYADHLLYCFYQDRPAAADDTRCTFFAELAASETAYRQHIPLINGEQIRNFGGRGTEGLPVSGLALLSIHAMPLGCFKVGHLMAFHQLVRPSDRVPARYMRYLAGEALKDYRFSISMMSPGKKDGNMPSHGSYQRSRYVDVLLDARQRMLDINQDAELANVTGYYFSNYGPSPTIDVVALDNAALNFVNRAVIDLPDAWERAVNIGWDKPRKERQLPPTPDNTRRWRNRLYEALFDLPANAPRVARLLMAGGSWELVQLFLERVLNMQRTQVEAYRYIGERLAHYIEQYNRNSDGSVSWSLYHKIKKAKGSRDLRSHLNNAREDYSAHGNTDLLIDVDRILLALEQPNMSYADLMLARDLIVMVIFDTLHGHGYNMDGTSPEYPYEQEVEN